jgi:hypothetical protein
MIRNKKNPISVWRLGLLVPVILVALVTILGKGGGGTTPAADGGDGGGGGGGDAGSGDNNSGTPTNKARILYDCDLNGVNGVLTINVELISDTGVTFGPGPNPDITGVIGTGGVTILTSGDLTSPNEQYIFTGTNDIADFTGVNTSERFRVRWIGTQQGVDLEINPFGPEPTRQSCVTTSAEFI